jgi:hypothetical protein
MQDNLNKSYIHNQSPYNLTAIAENYTKLASAWHSKVRSYKADKVNLKNNITEKNASLLALENYRSSLSEVQSLIIDIVKENNSLSMQNILTTLNETGALISLNQYKTTAPTKFLAIESSVPKSNESNLAEFDLKAVFTRHDLLVSKWAFYAKFVKHQNTQLKTQYLQQVAEEKFLDNRIENLKNLYIYLLNDLNIKAVELANPKLEMLYNPANETILPNSTLPQAVYNRINSALIEAVKYVQPQGIDLHYYKHDTQRLVNESHQVLDILAQLRSNTTDLPLKWQFTPTEIDIAVFGAIEHYLSDVNDTEIVYLPILESCFSANSTACKEYVQPTPKSFLDLILWTAASAATLLAISYMAADIAQPVNPPGEGGNPPDDGGNPPGDGGGGNPPGDGGNPPGGGGNPPGGGGNPHGNGGGGNNPDGGGSTNNAGSRSSRNSNKTKKKGVGKRKAVRDNHEDENDGHSSRKKTDEDEDVHHNGRANKRKAYEDADTDGKTKKSKMKSSKSDSSIHKQNSSNDDDDGHSNKRKADGDEDDGRTAKSKKLKKAHFTSEDSVINHFHDDENQDGDGDGDGNHSGNQHSSNNIRAGNHNGIVNRFTSPVAGRTRAKTATKGNSDDIEESDDSNDCCQFNDDQSIELSLGDYMLKARDAFYDSTKYLFDLTTVDPKYLLAGASVAITVGAGVITLNKYQSGDYDFLVNDKQLSVVNLYHEVTTLCGKIIEHNADLIEQYIEPLIG